MGVYKNKSPEKNKRANEPLVDWLELGRMVSQSLVQVSCHQMMMMMLLGVCPPNKFYKNIVVGIHHGRNVLLSPSSHGPQAAFTKTFDIIRGIFMPKPYQSGSSNDACPLRLLGILG